METFWEKPEIRKNVQCEKPVADAGGTANLKNICVDGTMQVLDPSNVDKLVTTIDWIYGEKKKPSLPQSIVP